MKLPEEFIQSLKWAVYEWIGSISVQELASNAKLTGEIERMCRRLNLLIA